MMYITTIYPNPIVSNPNNNTNPNPNELYPN